MAIEIVTFPINNADFLFYVSSPEGSVMWFRTNDVANIWIREK